MKRVFNLFSNKYFLGSLAFAIWMLFFDRNDLFSQYEYQQQVNKLKTEKEFYATETEKVKLDILGLSSKTATLEKFAREKYLMKKADEDIFVIIREEPKEKKKKRFFFF